ncbi:hypothetical protein Lesp02_07500 [Lentzea sp. NBRC 105346]|uniref:hypothetical protein n=1 Tax=Lentzea sp. NBRC 105346 TaxID=3032205 RepID=UPI0024A60041|nr:hypothetical protein [Lentzea sp. NBRC 105346]GLZ28560.1 hypothetical protein Lesp02_07500 [Lentzea sp. NBRC 105346]
MSVSTPSVMVSFVTPGPDLTSTDADFSGLAQPVATTDNTTMELTTRRNDMKASQLKLPMGSGDYGVIPSGGYSSVA